MFSMKQLLMGVYHICSNKIPWVKIGPAGGGGGEREGLYTGERPQGRDGRLVFKNGMYYSFLPGWRMDGWAGSVHFLSGAYSPTPMEVF
jgi:hypothetical protein